MTILPKNIHQCPYLILAPMEGVGDRGFRKAIASIGGFDEAVREFLRVPKNAHVKSLAVEYVANELAPIPLACQLMGSDVELMAAMAKEIESLGAPRIDINCGCPSNTVTSRGAGSSLLKEPDFLHKIAKSVVNAVSIPVTIKMRSGFDDTSLFKENLLAAQESGISYLTVHPRTKVDGYGPPAKWELIAEAKSLLSIPVVGNGDILNVEDALNMLKITKCDALMIGRGSLVNPFLFHEIKSAFSGNEYQASPEALNHYLKVFLEEIPKDVPMKTKINKLKQILSFLFKANESLLEMRKSILTSQFIDPKSLLDFALSYKTS